MNRRRFIQTGAAALALSRLPAYAAEFADQKKRVGLIGTGWYGKADLFRLIQVAPVEVVSLCDVDKRMLAEAAELVATRQASKKKPRTYGDYREMLKEKDLDIVLIATPGPLARAADDRRGEGGGRRLRAEADQRGRRRGPGDARRRAQAQARRAGGHAAPQHAAPDRGPRHHHQGREAGQGRPGRDLLLLPHARDGEPAGHRPARKPRLRDVDRPGADAALQRAGPPARLAGVHGVRQRHRGRHVHPHVRHGALDAGPRLAEAHQLLGRHPRGQGEQGEHHRHADRDVRFRRPAGRLDASHLGRPPTRNIRGARRSTATRARSRPA